MSESPDAEIRKDAGPEWNQRVQAMQQAKKVNRGAEAIRM